MDVKKFKFGDLEPEIGGTLSAFYGVVEQMSETPFDGIYMNMFTALSIARSLDMTCKNDISRDILDIVSKAHDAVIGRMLDGGHDYAEDLH